MQNNESKLQIYKGIIQYILQTTNYTLQDIADVCESSVNNIQAIYGDNTLPSKFSSDLQLISSLSLLSLNI